MNDYYIEKISQERIKTLHHEANEYCLVLQAYPNKRLWFLKPHRLWQRLAAKHNQILAPWFARDSKPGGENV